LSVELIR